MSELAVHFGFNEEGEAVSIPLFQMFFNATTGHGKTVGMKTLLWRFHLSFPDWKILIIDSKDKRDYADFNADIPICFVETTEPLDIKALLEPILGARMVYFFDQIIEEAVFDTLGEIQQCIQKKVTQADEGKLKIPRKELGKLRVLNHLLKKLIVLIDRPEITPELKLKPGLNVMPVSLPGVPSNLKRAYQWLIVRSIMLKLTEPQFEKVLVIMDEFHRWSPQRWASIVKQQISENVSEGRGKRVFYWMADQALSKVDKEPLKPVKVWVVGQQMGRHEVRYAIETVNDMTDLTVEKRDIKNLKVGFFIIVDGVNHVVQKAYLQPCGVSDSLAREIAIGQRAPKDAEIFISQFEFVTESMEVEDLVWKEKYEEERRIRKEFEKRLGEYSENLKELQGKIKELEKRLEETKTPEDIQAELDKLEKDVTELTGWLKVAKISLREAKDEIEPLRKFRDALRDILPKANIPKSNVPSKQISDAEITAIVDQRLHQLVSKKEEIRVINVAAASEIRKLVKNEAIKPLVSAFANLSKAVKKAARFMVEMNETTVGQLNEHLYHRAGRPAGALYINIINPLKEIGAISSDKGKVVWILRNSLKSKLPFLKAEETEKLYEHILSLLL